MAELVTVTGGSGFLGAHCVADLLRTGFNVRTTVRSLDRADSVRQQVREAGVEADGLQFAVADLMDDSGWAKAIEGSDYVMHVASPFPIRQPRDADELITPAREGTLRVLRAARDAGAKRVVLTSSFAAVGYGHGFHPEPFTEADWTNLEGPGVSAYVRSKTLAEAAAWDFVKGEGAGLELSVVNPVGIFGPALGPDLSSSVQLIRLLMSGSLPRLPRMSADGVDVRDVADLHRRAMASSAAAGERFNAVAPPSMSLVEVAAILRERLGHSARRVPTKEFPKWLLDALGRVSSAVRMASGETGRMISNEKARRVLGWEPRPAVESMVDSAESLIRLGLVKA